MKIRCGSSGLIRPEPINMSIFESHVGQFCEDNFSSDEEIKDFKGKTLRFLEDYQLNICLQGRMYTLDDERHDAKMLENSTKEVERLLKKMSTTVQRCGHEYCKNSGLDWVVFVRELRDNIAILSGISTHAATTLDRTKGNKHPTKYLRDNLIGRLADLLESDCIIEAGTSLVVLQVDFIECCLESIGVNPPSDIKKIIRNKKAKSA